MQPRRVVLLLICCAVALISVLGLLRSSAPADLAAFVGALLIPVILTFTISIYVGRYLGRPVDDEDELRIRSELAARRRQLDWPVAVAVAVLPGLWVGITADSPGLIGLAYITVLRGLGWVATLFDPRPADDPLRRPFGWESLLQQSVILLLATLAGRVARFMFHW